MKTVMKVASAGLMLLMVTSCTKSKTDTVIGLSFKGITTSTVAAKGASTVSPYTFTEALMGIKEIQIKRKEEQLHDTLTPRDTINKSRFNFKGKYLVDLLTGTTTPDFGLAGFVPGTYNKLESETARLVNGTNSISVKGSFTDAASKVYNFNFSTKSEFEFEFESDSGFVLTEGGVLQMLININLPKLFTNVDFSTALVDSNGTVVITENTNAELYKRIKRNIRSTAEIHEDKHKEKTGH
jgi:hypothetical protein